MKKIVQSIVFVLLGSVVHAQSIWVIDFVEVKNGNDAELRFFVENNWKKYREEALKQKVIKSYMVLENKPDSTAKFSYMLMTEFADSTALKRVEEGFRPIMKGISPNGPKFLNDKKPNDFRAIPISIESKVWIAPKP